MRLTLIILFCIFIGEIGGGNCPLNGFALCPSHLLSNASLNNVIMSKRREFTTDDKFNSLTFLKELDPLIRKAKYGKGGIGYERVMLWRCDCGNEKAIRMSSVINGSTKTCGCLHAEVSRKLLKQEDGFKKIKRRENPF